MSAIAEILGAAHHNNRRDEITAALLIHEGEAVQMVEGARVDLDRLIGRLKSDPRRAGLRILSDRPVAQRRLTEPARLCVVPGGAADTPLRGRRLSDIPVETLERILGAEAPRHAA